MTRPAGLGRGFLVAILLAAATASGGCGLGGQGPTDPREVFPAPTAETLRQIRAARFPVYWLGPSFHGMELSTAQISEDSAGFGYGDLGRCDSFDGCSGPPLTVFSFARTRDPFFPPAGSPEAVCFRHLRAAAVLTCGDSDEFDLFTGRGYVFISVEAEALSGADVARALRPIDPAAGSAHLLPPPAPLECRQFRRVIRWFVVFAQKHFGPSHCARFPKYSKTR